MSARDLERLGYYEDSDGTWVKGKAPKKEGVAKHDTLEASKTNFILHIDPCAKPRMTQRDKFNPSEAAIKYFNWKDDLEREAHRLGMPIDLPGQIKSLIFMVPIPKSWSVKKKNAMYSRPHQQRPDLDNYLKAFQDALCKEDSHIYSIQGELGKYWNTEGRIILKL